MTVRALLLLPFLPWPALAVSPAKTCSTESLYLVNKAIECYNHEDFGCSKLAVEQVLKHQPGCAQALHVESFLLERDGKIGEAQALRERAETLDPELKEFWTQRGHFIEENAMSGQAFSNFNLRFHGSQNRDKAWQAVQYLNDAYGTLGSLFGEYPRKKIEVIVFTGPEFLDAWRAPFIGGFFDQRDGKVRVRVEEMPGGDKEFKRVCRHELTHAFLRQLYPHDLPGWFAEGSAEFYASYGQEDSLWRENRLVTIERMTRGMPRLSLAEIRAAIEKKKGSLQQLFLSYLYSEALVIQVAKERGDSWIPRVVAQLREGRTFPDAFVEVTGVPAETFLDRMYHSWE